MTPEQSSRKTIDRLLHQCGWLVQDYRKMDLSAGPGIAVREFPLATGHADYLLYVDRRALGVIEAKPVQENALANKVWVYDSRTNSHFTRKQNQLTRVGFLEFVECYKKPANRQRRRATWSEEIPGGRWRVCDCEELITRDKVNLDLFWLKDKSLEGDGDLPDPDVIAEEITDELQTALDQFAAIAEELRE